MRFLFSDSSKNPNFAKFSDLLSPMLHALKLHFVDYWYIWLVKLVKLAIPIVTPVGSALAKSEKWHLLSILSPNTTQHTHPDPSVSVGESDYLSIYLHIWLWLTNIPVTTWCGRRKTAAGPSSGWSPWSPGTSRASCRPRSAAEGAAASWSSPTPPRHSWCRRERERSGVGANWNKGKLRCWN